MKAAVLKLKIIIIIIIIIIINGTVCPVSGIPQYCENEGQRVSLDIKEAKCFTCWCRVSDIT